MIRAASPKIEGVLSFNKVIMSGWIKMHRKFLEWEWFNKSEAVHLFLYMLLKANHKSGKWQGIDIERGQFISSLGNISNATGISLQTIRTILKKLEKTNEIEIKSTSQYTLVTICKYECYQDENEPTNKPITSNQQTTNKQLTTNKNEKNEKNERSIFIEPTYNEILEYCTQRKNGIDVNKFLNFYASKGWMVGKNKMKDWKACIRSWEKPIEIPEVNEPKKWKAPWS
jgi:DNA-binding transcriptional MerR regulator